MFYPCQRICHDILTAPCAAVALFFGKPDRFIQGGKKFGAFISVTRHVLTQGAFKKFVQGHFDPIGVVTRIGFQEAVTD